jgi:hypothetical protein
MSDFIQETDSLRDQVEGLQTSISRNMTKDVSLVAGLKESSGDSKGKTVKNILRKLKLSQRSVTGRNKTWL